MNNLASTELLDEIRQIMLQSKDEVSGHRKTWPRSLRERVLELRNLGFSFKSISRETGIAYTTVYSWNIAAQKKKPKFKQIRNSYVSTVESSTVETKESPLKVTTPGGFIVDGLTFNQVMQLLGRAR